MLQPTSAHPVVRPRWSEPASMAELLPPLGGCSCAIQDANTCIHAYACVHSSACARARARLRVCTKLSHFYPAGPPTRTIVCIVTAKSPLHMMRSATHASSLQCLPLYLHALWELVFGVYAASPQAACSLPTAGYECKQPAFMRTRQRH